MIPLDVNVSLPHVLAVPQDMGSLITYGGLGEQDAKIAVIT